MQRSLIIAALSPARFADVRRIPVVKRSVIMAASSLLMLLPATANGADARLLASGTIPVVACERPDCGRHLMGVEPPAGYEIRRPST
ncbi:MAG: hypothetical protein ACREL7_17455 [Longimicrobiales bacterium]